jgi:ankyrin repeat protein
MGTTDFVDILCCVDGIDINSGKGLGWALLPLAASSGNTEVVERLLQMPGVDANANQPLAKAARGGHLDVVERLLRVPEVDINAGFPLASAIVGYRWKSQSHLKVIERLLQVPDTDVDAVPLLSLSSQRNSADMVKFLLQFDRVDKDKKDMGGWTALQWAWFNGYVPIIRILENAGCR